MKNREKAGLWTTPLWLALPFAAAMIYAGIRWGSTVADAIHVVIKLVVTA